MHQRAALRVGLPLPQRLQDRRVAPSLGAGVIHAQCVDNFISAGTGAKAVAPAVRGVAVVLRCVGLKVHDIEEGLQSTELLSWNVDGVEGVVGQSRRRLWRVRLGLRAVLARDLCSGADLEGVVGDMTFISLVARPAILA